MPHNRPRLAFDHDTLRRTLDALGMIVNNAADFLEKDRKSISRWLGDLSPVPVEVAMLLALMRKTKTHPNDVRKLVGLDPITLGDARLKDEDDEPKKRKRR